MEQLEAKDFPEVKDGKVTMSFNQYLKCLTEAKAKGLGREPPYQQFLSNASFIGRTQENCVNFDIKFKVVVIQDEDWIETPLFRSNITIHSQNYEVISNQDESSSEAYFSYTAPFHVFIAKKGIYNIKMNISVPYKSKQKKGFSLWIPQSTYNYIDFTVNSSAVDIQVDSGLEMEYEHTNDTTRVTGRLPAKNNLSVEWTQKIAPSADDMVTSQPVEEVKKPMSVHSSHNILHTVGDRLITSTIQTRYSINNGSLSSLAIRIQSFGKFLRILRVDGPSIKKWEVVNRGTRRNNNNNNNTDNNNDTEFIENLSETSSERSSNREPYKLLKVYLNHSVEGGYTLNIHTELELPSSTCQLKFPSFSCTGVDRDRGYIAVEAKSSVEVNENQIFGVGRVDKSELPWLLKNKATNPIIYSYKFLQRDHWFDVLIKKHEDVDVLVTCIDEGYFVATYGEGMVLHHTSLNVRNTQKQYLRVSLPPKSSIWSVSVEKEPVKPAVDKEGHLLVPLKQSGSNDSAPFPVEIVFVERSNEFDSYGDINCSFAQFDIPINHLFVSVYVPKNAEYGEFTGTIKEVESFSKNPKLLFSKRQPQYPAAFASSNVMPQVQVASNVSRFDEAADDDLFSINESVSSLAEDEEEEEEEEEQSESIFTMETGGADFKQSSGIGMLPVMIDQIAIGKEFRFEKVLASADERIYLSVPFKKVSKGFFSKRRTYNLGYIIGTSVTIGSVALSYCLANFVLRQN